MNDRCEWGSTKLKCHPHYRDVEQEKEKWPWEAEGINHYYDKASYYQFRNIIVRPKEWVEL